MADDKSKAKSEAKEEETPNTVDEAAKNWPEGQPDSVKEYEALRANPPAEQEGLTPKPE
jgi:hypothetical protein